MKENYPCYLVTCLDDQGFTHKNRLIRILATRQVFNNRKTAKEYAKTINKKRHPQILPVPRPIAIITPQLNGQPQFDHYSPSTQIKYLCAI